MYILMISHLTFVILLNSGLWRHRRMQRARQRRLHCKLSLSQLCGKMTVRYYLNTTHGSCGAVVSLVPPSNVLIPAQGSYHCGSCKSGFTGDQVKGCKPELSCLTNPCDINALCNLERDGSISCQVGCHTFSLSAHTLSEFLKGFICLVSVELAGPVTDTCVGRIPTLTDTQMRSSNAKM